jgi:aspartyl-tRNA(Asn)/glutamyl-tRNA(Gln) amidotransferase subunit B
LCEASLASSQQYEPVIGLEVHAQLKTVSKMFCGCKVTYAAPPNSRSCPVCLGMPGALPTVNRRAVEFAIRMILAVGGEVQSHSTFARKNYFYPDLPKGYQITQHDKPIGLGGSLDYRDSDGVVSTCRIARIHLEEDAGKLLHPDDEQGVYSRIDFNRCGVPLVEIVTEPDIISPDQAYEYLLKLKQTLQYLRICSGDMEKGQLRCDANVSVRRKDEPTLGVRTEIKNLNSFRAVRQALQYEVERQTRTLKSGGAVVASTLLWDEKTRTAQIMREKEESPEYRYFPEPDLPVLNIDGEWIESIKEQLPELPDDRKSRFIEQYHLREHDAAVLTGDRALADFFEAVMAQFGDARVAANWVNTELLGRLKKNRLEPVDCPVEPSHFASLLGQMKSGTLSGPMAKQVLDEMIASGKDPVVIVKERRLELFSDERQLERIVDHVLAENEEVLRAYRTGNKNTFGYFVGQVMKATDGKASPQAVTRILQQKLDDD